MTGPLSIDGSHGEGGGQILRTSLTFSALLGQPIRIHDIRAGRPRPGLAAQHLTAIRAAAAICAADLRGDSLGSASLDFTPTRPSCAGTYRFDVAEAREGGSAGATSLILQTILLPLALTDGASHVTLLGGTHMQWSPSFDYLRDVWLPAFSRLGMTATIGLRDWGWFPIGKGVIEANIRGRAGHRPGRLETESRGELLAVEGRAVAANLPANIAQRMADRASALLRDLPCPVAIDAARVHAACAGAGIFLTARYAQTAAGFSSHGARGKPAEEVAEEAARSLLAHHASGAAFDIHLGDQILVPLALADGPSRFTVAAATRHLETNAWVIERFGLARIEIERRADGTSLVTVTPRPGNKLVPD